MDEWQDYDQLMDWTDRLHMLAHVQGSYLDVLRDQGFDAEQAFVLVRDWSGRVYDWTVRHHMGMLPFEHMPGIPGPVDPTGAEPSEPYLIALDEPPEGGAEPNPGTAGRDDDLRHDEAA